MLDRSRALGLDPDALRRALGVDETVLRDPDGRVPLTALYDLVERVIDDTGDPHAHLRLAQQLDVEAFDALGLLVMSSPTFGVALERTLEYQRVFAEGERYDAITTERAVHVRYVPWGPPRPAHVAMADVFARDLAVNVAMVTGAPIPGVQVRLRRSTPSDPARWEALLGVRAELDAPVDEVVLPKDALDVAIPRADAVLARFFARYLDARLAKLPAPSWTARAERAIEELLPRGEPTLAALARRMHASPRTLQRRLDDERTTFGALLDAVRRSRALALVEAGVSIAEVAWMLGYSEPSAFHRAFRRWTGETPATWRARRS
ncbi:AraC family transcriptional regulator [Sandaracinus amylolyticus]|nr:AraC family transcriptional regulator [Sandaracinus amylolyticus]